MTKPIGRDKSPEGDAHNKFSGSAGSVVQVGGDIHGGVNINASWRLSSVAAVAFTAAMFVLGFTIAQQDRLASSPTVKHHGPPVKINYVTVQRTATQAGTYIFPGKLKLTQAELQSLNQLQELTPAYDAWFRGRGGVDPDTSNVQLVVKGNADQTVRIIGIDLIKICKPPLNGTLFLSPSAGDDSAILLNFNLDNPRSVALTPSGQPYFAGHTISLRPDEPQVIELVSSTARQYCQYSFQMTILVDDRTTVETVDDNGQPFQVTAVDANSTARYQALYVGGVGSPAHNHSFVPEDPASWR